jgi:hypothetical protein
MSTALTEDTMMRRPLNLTNRTKPSRTINTGQDATRWAHTRQSCDLVHVVVDQMAAPHSSPRHARKPWKECRCAGDVRVIPAL